MKLTIGHIQHLKRLEGVRLNLIEALQKIGPVPTVLRTGEEYLQAQCILKDWIAKIETEIAVLEGHLGKCVNAAWTGNEKEGGSEYGKTTTKR